MEKKLLVVVMMVVGVLCSAALAGGPLGPPMSTLKHGEWAIDAGYFYEEMDLWGCGTYSEGYRYYDYGETEPNEGLGEWGDWSIYGSGYDQNVRLLGFQTNTWLASLEYGLCDNWDVYFRAGIADAEADVGFREEEYDEEEGEYYCVIDKTPVDFDYGFAWQVGAAFTICQSGPWTFGGRMQFGAAYPGSWSDSYSDEWEDVDVNGVDEGKTSADLDWWQAVAYLGATYELNPALHLYAGGGWQTLEGSLDVKHSMTRYVDYYDDGELYPYYAESYNGSFKLKHTSAIGVFGVLWAPTDNAKVGGELLIGEAGKWGIGVTAAFPLP
jgi:hypothetical protein